MKLKIVSCDDHDYSAVYLDGKLIASLEESTEYLYYLAKHLNWEIESEEVDSGESVSLGVESREIDLKLFELYFKD